MSERNETYKSKEDVRGCDAGREQGYHLTKGTFWFTIRGEQVFIAPFFTHNPKPRTS
jgi:hypothetical protein